MQIGEDRVVNNEEYRSSILPLEYGDQFGKIRVYESSLLTCPDSWVVYNCRYNYHRLYYIYGGEAVYRDEKRSVPLKKGFLYVFPSKIRKYQIEQSLNAPLRVLWCHFDVFPEFMNGLIEYDCSADDELDKALKLWESLTRLESPGNEISCIVFLILSLLSRRIGFERAAGDFTRIEQMINDGISQGITVETLAASMGYERSYFSRKFKSVYGVAPGKYILYMKMFEAARLLEGGLSVSETGARLGYEDSKAFSRAFRVYYRLSPSEYRRKAEKTDSVLFP